jgi:pimeloyl-ACP methyl ester carboxylesterase
MSSLDRARRMAADVAGVLPRAYTAVADSDRWEALSPAGVRQLAEVALDEMALTGMTLTGPGPTLVRSLESCRAAAVELSELGMERAHAEPAPLRVRASVRRRFGRLRYERVTFDHDPAFPPTLTDAGLGGPATAAVHLIRDGDEPRPWLVWIHGAGQGQPLDLLFSRAARLQRELGFNVALPVQPGHGARRSQWPPYPDMDPLGNVAGMMRAVSEARAVVRWLAPQATRLAVSGVSMGSPVAALVSHFEESVDAVAVYTPIFGLNAMIAHHLGRWGPSAHATEAVLASDTVAAMSSVADLLAVTPAPPPERRLIVGAWHDRMAMREPAQQLHRQWGGDLYWHDGSHVGHILSRRVQAVSERFLRGLT